MRFGVVLRFVIVGVLVAVVLSYGYVRALQPARPIGSLLVSADGRTLAGTVDGCFQGHLEVSESDEWVAVWLRSSPDLMLAPGSCAMESFTATLRRPLGDRLLVDGVTHEAVPSFSGTGILRPATLPDGFVHRYDTASFPDENVVGGKAGCVQLYTEPDGYDESVWIAQVPGGRWKPPDGVVPQQISVRGYPGYAIAGEIVWTERGQLVTVESRAYAYAVLSQAQLLAIAESLR